MLTQQYKTPALDTACFGETAGSTSFRSKFGLIAALVGSTALLWGCEDPSSREAVAARLGATASGEVDRLLSEATYIDNQSVEISQNDALRLAVVERQSEKGASTLLAEYGEIKKRTSFTTPSCIDILCILNSNPQGPSLENYCDTINAFKELETFSFSMSEPSAIILTSAHYRSKVPVQELFDRYLLISRSGTYEAEVAALAVSELVGDNIVP